MSTDTVESIRAELSMESLPWAHYPHAYGAASDTPAHLLAVLDGDEQARQSAVQHLGSAIVHQSTIWPATADALELLLRILVVQPLPDPVVLGCLGVLVETGDAVRDTADSAAVPVLSAEAVTWLSQFSGADEVRRDELWEESFGTRMYEEIHQWMTVRCARLRPKVDAAVASLSGRGSKRVVEMANTVRSSWAHR